MARNRSPARDEARAIWEKDATRSLKSIAEELGVDEGRVRKWKCLDKWEQGNGQKERAEQKATKATEKKLAAVLEQNEELNDKQRAFCLYYVQTYHATNAYQRAYGCSRETAMTNCSRLFQNPAIREQIRLLKELRSFEIMASAEDVVLLHMRIAFADITDYVEFGRATVPVMGPFGPIVLKDDDGNKTELKKEINEVRFKESSEIDGRLVAEVKQGRDGVSIKLADRQKSLAFLEKWFELNPMDKHRKAYDTARLELERRKQGDTAEVEDDGFVEALTSAAQEVWNDEDKSDVPV